MLPAHCRVKARLSDVETETAGTIAVEKPPDDDAIRLAITGPDLAVTATLSREQAFALLLSAADALGMVLLDPKDAARRTAKLRRGR